MTKRKNYNTTVCTPEGKEAYRYHMIKKGMNSKKAILCIETGIQYDSLTQAAKEMNLSTSSISAHMTGRKGYEKVHGYTFRKI